MMGLLFNFFGTPCVQVNWIITLEIMARVNMPSRGQIARKGGKEILCVRKAACTSNVQKSTAIKISLGKISADFTVTSLGAMAVVPAASNNNEKSTRLISKKKTGNPMKAAKSGSGYVVPSVAARVIARAEPRIMRTTGYHQPANARQRRMR